MNLTKAVEYLRLLSLDFVVGQFTSSAAADASAPAHTYIGIGPSNPNGDLTETEISQRLDEVTDLAERIMYAPIAFAPEGAACASLRGLSARGITVIGTPPNVYVPPERLTSFRALEPKLKEFYEGCGAHFVADDTGGFQDLSAMLDTPYHLTREARRVRTTRLIEALCEEILSCKR